MRRVLSPLAVRRLRPTVPEGQPPPWTDCDTPADLERARAAVRKRPWDIRFSAE
jgi:NDP-sugar pyrophosphorylase family protein